MPYAFKDKRTAQVLRQFARRISGNPIGKSTAGRVDLRTSAGGDVALGSPLPGFISAHLIEPAEEITAATISGGQLTLGSGEAYILLRSPTGTDWYSAQTGSDPETHRQTDAAGDDYKIRVWNYTTEPVPVGDTRHFACQNAWGDYMLVRGGPGGGTLTPGKMSTTINVGETRLMDVYGWDNVATGTQMPVLLHPIAGAPVSEGKWVFAMSTSGPNVIIAAECEATSLLRSFGTFGAASLR